MRGRAVAARRAHNPEVGRSNRPPAIKKTPQYWVVFVFPVSQALVSSSRKTLLKEQNLTHSTRQRFHFRRQVQI